MEKQSLPPRSDVPFEETWNLENIFPDVESWETAKEDILNDIPALAAYKGKLSKDPQSLADFLECYENTACLTVLWIQQIKRRRLALDKVRACMSA